jgi:hypothetical protein
MKKPSPFDLLKAQELELSSELIEKIGVRFTVENGASPGTIKLSFSAIGLSVVEVRQVRKKLFEKWVPKRIRKLVGDRVKLELELWGNVWQHGAVNLFKPNVRIYHDGADAWSVRWDTWEGGFQQAHAVQGTLREVLASVPEGSESANRMLSEFL